MYRIIAQFVIIVLSCLSILACDKLSEPGSDEILNKFLDAYTKGRYEEAYSYVSAEDKSIKTFKNFLKENDNPTSRAIFGRLSYKILKLEKADNKATADVEITFPDIGSMIDYFMEAASKSDYDTVHGNEKEMEKMLAKKFDSGEVPFTTKKVPFQLVKESDGWKVFLGWGNRKN